MERTAPYLYKRLQNTSTSFGIWFKILLCFQLSILLKILVEIGRVPSEIKKITKITKKCNFTPLLFHTALSVLMKLEEPCIFL